MAIDEVKISVIVPIYNAEQYLKKCIDSILEQTYRNLEIILVNDGSTDSSLDICKTYEQLDARVRILSKSNGGIVSARIAGVQQTRGDFIGWVDADDWIEKDYFSKLVEAQKDSGVDIVVAGHYHEIGNTKKRVFNNFSVGIYSIQQMLERLLYVGEFFEFGIQPHVYNKLIKSNILKHTQPMVDKYICAGDDVAVIYPSLLEAEKIYVTDICGYHYVQHQGSITKVLKRNEKKRMDILMCHLTKVFEQKGVSEILAPQLVQYRKYFLLTRSIETLDEVSDNADNSNILQPYGGIPVGSRVIIYGAGVLGQRIFQYIRNNNLGSIVLWVDQNFLSYVEMEMTVCSPNDIASLSDRDYDYILIANTVCKTAGIIRQYLIEQLKVSPDKVRWLTREFVDEGYRTKGKER